MHRCSVVSAVPYLDGRPHGQRSTEPSRRAARRVAAFGAPALALAAVASLAAGAGAAHAADSLGLTTPYPTIETQPGSTVKVDLDVAERRRRNRSTSTSAACPTDGQATLRGGGFVIHSITTTPDKPAAADLEIVVDPPDAAPASTRSPSPATDPTGGAVDDDVTLDVVDAGQQPASASSADFPSLAATRGRRSRTT